MCCGRIHVTDGKRPPAAAAAAIVSQDEAVQLPGAGERRQEVARAAAAGARDAGRGCGAGAVARGARRASQGQEAGGAGEGEERRAEAGGGGAGRGDGPLRWDGAGMEGAELVWSVLECERAAVPGDPATGCSLGVQNNGVAAALTGLVAVVLRAAPARHPAFLQPTDLYSVRHHLFAEHRLCRRVVGPAGAGRRVAVVGLLVHAHQVRAGVHLRLPGARGPQRVGGRASKPPCTCLSVEPDRTKPQRDRAWHYWLF